MNSGRWVWLLGILVAAALFCAPRAAAQEAAPQWEKVVFEASGGGAHLRDGHVVVRLLTPTEAEVVPAGGAEPTRGTWSEIRGAIVRFVEPDRTVRWFALEERGVREAGFRVALRVVSGADWHAAALARGRKGGEIEPFGADEGIPTFVLHADGAADWSADGASLQAATHVTDAEGNLSLTLADGTKRTFRRDGDCWVEIATGVRFDSLLRQKRERLACLKNLSQLGGIFIAERTEKPGKPKYDGIALFLSWRSDGSKIREGEEWVLRCPADPHLRPLDDGCRKAYDGVDLKNPPDDLCSYAGRDFTAYPLSYESKRVQAIACCRQGRDGKTPHHKGGIVVLFDTGSAQFMTREELGLAPDDPIVVGPDSKSELLKPIWVPKKR